MHIATDISLAALFSAVAVSATSMEARSARGCPGIWGNDKTDKGLAVIADVKGVWVPDGEKVDPVVLDLDNMYICTAACWKNKDCKGVTFDKEDVSVNCTLNIGPGHFKDVQGMNQGVDPSLAPSFDSGIAARDQACEWDWAEGASGLDCCYVWFE